MRWFSLVLMVVLVVLFPVLALAEPCAPCPPVSVELVPHVQLWWEVLLSHLVDIVGSLFLIIVPVLIRALIAKWGAKLSAEKQLAVQKLVDGVLGGAVAFAEEQSKKALHADGTKTESAEKLDLAISYARDQLVKSGVRDIADDELVRLLESKLHLQRTVMDESAIIGQKRLETSAES